MSKDFPSSLHGSILTCIDCHGGRNVADANEAHAGVVKDPSADKGGVCVQCHESITTPFADSMHFNISGIRSVMEAYAGKGIIEQHAGIQKAWELDCANCHATCGSCHVSRPAAAHGGLLAGHDFVKTPPMDKTCYACHGARTSGEFVGEIGPTADVHYQKGMTCVSCHGADAMHGVLAARGSHPAMGEGKQSPEKQAPGGIQAQAEAGAGLTAAAAAAGALQGAPRYYNVPGQPTCVSCHPDAAPGKSNIAMHNAHPANLLSCEVCHSQQSQSCYNCHVLYADGGTKVMAPVQSAVTFKIAKNPDPGPNNPYKYVVVRHAPVVANTFAPLGLKELENFDAIPNWGPAPIHNIQKHTPQNASCNACHGNAALFLTAAGIRKNDPKADLQMVVDPIPAPVK